MKDEMRGQYEAAGFNFCRSCKEPIMDSCVCPRCRLDVCYDDTHILLVALENFKSLPMKEQRRLLKPKPPIFGGPFWNQRLTFNKKILDDLIGRIKFSK